jgi:16S rRNA (guanine1207-N2)-methyltransferase
MTTPGEHYFSARPEVAAAPRRITVRLADRDLEVTTAAGVFSPGHVDLGTRVLLREAPSPPDGGHLLDLGCGWGPLALTLALLAPAATVWAVDVNERSLDLTGRNARSLGLAGVRACLPEQVPAGQRFSAIWSNPPVRIGKSALHDLLLLWLPRLLPGAAAHLVVQRNLGADSLQAWLTATLPADWWVARAGSAKGYRVLTVTAPAESPAG